MNVHRRHPGFGGAEDRDLLSLERGEWGADRAVSCPSGGARSCFANRDDMGGYFAAARTAWAKAAWACQSSSFDATGQAELTAMTSFSAG